MRLTVVSALAAGILLAGSAGAQEYIDIAPQVGVIMPSSRSFLGVGVADVNAERVKALKLKEERGVEITRVENDSPATKAGLKVGDVVLEYNGQRVEGTEQFVRMVRETPEGRQVRLQISRDGATQTITATVAARKDWPFGGPQFDNGKFRAQMEELQQRLSDEKSRGQADRLRAEMEQLQRHMRSIPDVPRPNMSWQSGTLGVVAESLDGQLAEYFGVKEGVLVRSVSKNSAAEKGGLKAGDVITKIDEAKVDTPREITTAVRNLGSKRTFPVTVLRNHKEMSVTVTLAERREGRPAPPDPPSAPPPPSEGRF